MSAKSPKTMTEALAMGYKRINDVHAFINAKVAAAPPGTRDMHADHFAGAAIGGVDCTDPANADVICRQSALGFVCRCGADGQCRDCAAAP